MRDRVGLGWRPCLAAGILANLDRIDVLEVIADDHFRAPARALRALRTLGAQRPLLLHGVGLGLASAHPVEPRRAEALARLCGAVEPESWSEHLAFVRAGGREIGHLAAPPRTAATVDGACRNLEVLRRVVGSLPALENVATLVEPPASTLGEPAWISAIAGRSGCHLLLDLHNLYANAMNFGPSPQAFLDALPLARVRSVHLAGGRAIRTRRGGIRILDDHLHATPPEVFALLEDVAARCPQPLTVLLERDGDYPAMAELLGELDAARSALAAGRRRTAA